MRGTNKWTSKCIILRISILIVKIVVQLLSYMTPWTVHQVPLSFTISQSLLKFMSTESVMLSNHLILCLPFSFCLQSFPASGSFPINWLIPSGGQSIGASAQHQSFQWIFRVDFLWNWLVWPYSPSDSQESSSNPQFKNNYLALSLLYVPTVTSIHDYWRNHSFDNQKTISVKLWLLLLLLLLSRFSRVWLRATP